MTYLSEWMMVRNRFESLWNPEIPIDWPNEEFRSKPVAPAPWVRIRTRATDAKVASVGNHGRYRHDGDLIVEIFTGLGTGLGDAADLGDVVAGIFRAWQQGTLVFWAPVVIQVGEEGGWWKTNVVCPYQWDAQFAHQMT